MRPTPKVLGMTRSCGKCPNYTYYSGGTHVCSLVDKAVLEKDEVAPFCPLPDYPSEIILDMQTTIVALREPLKYGFGMHLLTHVAAKLKRNLSSRGSGIQIPLKHEERSIYLGVHYITTITVNPFEIEFHYRDGLFRLAADGDPPELRELSDPEKKLWRHHEIA
jgi:hypothetical protein